MQRHIFQVILIIFVNFSCHLCQVHAKTTKTAVKTNKPAKAVKSNVGTKSTATTAKKGISKLYHIKTDQEKFMDAHKQGQCLLADQFGLKTSPITIQRKGKLEICKEVKHSCCSTETWNTISKTWMDHKNEMNLKSEAKIRIVRLILQLTKNLSVKVKTCVKNSPKLKKKLEKKRRMLDVPISQQNNSPTSGNSDCTLNVNQMRKVIKEMEKTRTEYEVSRRQCTAELLKQKSQLLCASCDPKNRISVIAYLKTVLVSSHDIDNLGNGCKKAYYFEFTMLRKFVLNALSIIKNAYGIPIKNQDYLESQFDQFSPEQCFNTQKWYGKVTTAKLQKTSKLEKKGKPVQKTDMFKQFMDEKRRQAVVKAKSSPSDNKNKTKKVQKKKQVHKKKKAKVLVWKKVRAKTDDQIERSISSACRRGIAYMSRAMFSFTKTTSFSHKYYKLFEFVFRALGNTNIETSWKNIVPDSQIPKGVKLIKPYLKSSKVRVDAKIKEKEKPKVTTQKKSQEAAPFKKRYKNTISIDPHKKWQFSDSRDSKRHNLFLNNYKKTGLNCDVDEQFLKKIVDKLTDM